MKEKQTKVKKINSKRNEIVLKSYFKNILKLAEVKYNSEVTFLLREIEMAEKKKDFKTLKKAGKIAETWIKYFETLGELVKKSATKKDKTKTPTLKFIKDQIKFFKILIKELDKKFTEGKFGKIRKELESKK